LVTLEIIFTPKTARGELRSEPYSHSTMLLVLEASEFQITVLDFSRTAINDEALTLLTRIPKLRSSHSPAHPESATALFTHDALPAVLGPDAIGLTKSDRAGS